MFQKENAMNSHMNIRKSYVVLAGLTCILCLSSSSWFKLLKNNAKVDNGTATSRIKMSLRAQLNALGEGRGQTTSSSLSYYNEEELAKQIPSCAEHVFLTLHKQKGDQQQWQESNQHRNEKEEDVPGLVRKLRNMRALLTGRLRNM